MKFAVFVGDYEIDYVEGYFDSRLDAEDYCSRMSILNSENYYVVELPNLQDKYSEINFNGKIKEFIISSHTKYNNEDYEANAIERRNLIVDNGIKRIKIFVSKAEHGIDAYSIHEESDTEYVNKLFHSIVNNDDKFINTIGNTIEISYIQDRKEFLDLYVDLLCKKSNNCNF